MDQRHKIFVIVGSIAILASSGMGGAYLFAAPDKSIAPEVSQVVTSKAESKTSTTPSTQTPTTANTSQQQPATPASTPTTPVTPTTPTTPMQPTTPPSTPPTPPSTPVYTYKDGQYTVSLRYSNGHGKYNTITTVLTVSKDIVSAASVSQVTGDPESQSYFDSFQSKFSPYVVSKALLGLSPSRIGGASLTTAAFDSTLDSIRTTAKS
jgi:hypothetical protein